MACRSDSLRRFTGSFETSSRNALVCPEFLSRNGDACSDSSFITHDEFRHSEAQCVQLRCDFEVAALFVGIFICMQAPVQLLHTYGPALGFDSPTKFYWGTGILSSFLDNAPTYVVFFETAKSIEVEGITEAGVWIPFLKAIALGSVFMGTMTYIGNGPNFMVKAIAEANNIKMPSFFGYMMYSFVVLLPLSILMNLLFP